MSKDDKQTGNKRKVPIRAGPAKPPRTPTPEIPSGAVKKNGDLGGGEESGKTKGKKLKSKTTQKFRANPPSEEEANENPKAKAKAKCSRFLMRMRACRKDKTKKRLSAKEKRARIAELIRKRDEEKARIFGDGPLVIGSSEDES